MTKVTKPLFEKIINRSMIESNILSGAQFNVQSRPGQVRLDFDLVLIDTRSLRIDRTSD